MMCLVFLPPQLVIFLSNTQKPIEQRPITPLPGHTNFKVK